MDDADMPLLEIKGPFFPYSIPVYDWPEQAVCWGCDRDDGALNEHTVLWHITEDRLCYIRLSACVDCSVNIKPEAWSTTNAEEDPYWSQIVKDIDAKKQDFNMKTMFCMLRCKQSKPKS